METQQGALVNSEEQLTNFRQSLEALQVLKFAGSDNFVDVNSGRLDVVSLDWLLPRQ